MLAYYEFRGFYLLRKTRIMYSNQVRNDEMFLSATATASADRFAFRGHALQLTLKRKTLFKVDLQITLIPQESKRSACAIVMFYNLLYRIIFAFTASCRSLFSIAIKSQHISCHHRCRAYLKA
ncbi:hypothetical protein SAMN04487943_10942 [Gracilibacillus orientalis]|uniref:Uncharacterized protein n=1 Tax=Gracilibacillus orientalis TaxID=334253 RepID=A0A1I4NNG0_9BACI|nr:hypothetical protein SAMN04487943_10942 [Gracilibacillus orientalis]